MGHADQDEWSLDVGIVGAGFAGLSALYRQRGVGFSARASEARPEHSETGDPWVQRSLEHVL